MIARMLGLLLLVQLTVLPLAGQACNPMTVTFPTPVTTLQGTIVEAVSKEIEKTTGLNIKREKARSYEQYFDLYSKSSIDVIVLTGEENPQLRQRFLALGGTVVEARGSATVYLLHPDFIKLFPKMKELFTRFSTLAGVPGLPRPSPLPAP